MAQAFCLAWWKPCCSVKFIPEVCHMTSALRFASISRCSFAHASAFCRASSSESSGDLAFAVGACDVGGSDR
eukprot:scaffold336_cov250-Pinguiococcus_pyrenoidosus.AAC.34